jgi:Phage major tail protein 2.
MATTTGSEGTIKIGTDVVGELRSFSLESTAETIEDTSMGDTNRSYKVGLKTFTGTASVFFDVTDTAQNALDAGAEITLNVFPEGASSGDTFYTGSGIVTGRTINSSFDGMVEMEISFQGNGALTESTA